MKKINHTYSQEEIFDDIEFGLEHASSTVLIGAIAKMMYNKDYIEDELGENNGSKN